MEKGQTASRYVSVWPREAVNNAGDEAIAIYGALLWLFDGGNWGNGNKLGDYTSDRRFVSAGWRGGT